ncbi:MAG TPA: VOC family protein [Dehalococcoidia bacterium]|nr:VOC family protein [Dehalococcoidia bacterium]
MTLADMEVNAFAATARPEEALRFYRDVLGLPLEADEPYALVFDCAGTQLRISKVQEVHAAPYTVLGWRVDDIVAGMAALASKGVTFERYEGMEQDENGVWTVPGGAMIAWFKDPDGNTLSLTQGL